MVVMVTRLSWLQGCHGYRLSWLQGCHVYKVFIELTLAVGILSVCVERELEADLVVGRQCASEPVSWEQLVPGRTVSKQ